FLVANLVVQVILQTATLFLIGAISLAVLSILGYLTSARRLPIALTACCIAIAGVLHNGEPPMRAKYWDADGMRHIPELSTLPAFYLEWIGYGIDPPDDGTGSKETAAQNLVRRTSLLQMVCLVVLNTPDHVPFIGNLTYSDIPVQLVPRPFWPNKPGGQWS